MQNLINACIVDEGKYYWCVSSPTMKDKPVQIRPWNLADSDFVMDGSQTLDPRKTIFVGGVPRPLRASESYSPTFHRLFTTPFPRIFHVFVEFVCNHSYISL